MSFWLVLFVQGDIVLCRILVQQRHGMPEDFGLLVSSAAQVYSAFIVRVRLFAPCHPALGCAHGRHVVTLPPSK